MAGYGDASDDLGSLLEALANKRRRIIIRYLATHGSAELSTLASIIADINGANTTPSNVYVSLYQTHAPHLDARNIVHYDSRQKQCLAGHTSVRVGLCLSVLIPSVKRHLQHFVHESLMQFGR